MKCLVLALLLVGTAPCADLDAIAAVQQKLVAARDINSPPRDEVPLGDVADAKRYLLAWADSRLRSSDRSVDPSTLTKALTDELNRSIKQASAHDMDRLGDLGISFSRPKGAPSWLQMSTAVGVQCGYDRSVYLYEWEKNRWNRRFTFEARDDRRSEYSPEDSVNLEISSPAVDGARIVLLTGLPPFCMSVWHTLNIRLFRIDKAQTSLLEAGAFANVGQGDPAYLTRLDSKDALIELFGPSIDSDLLVRKHVLHYKIDRGTVERVEPIALTVRDFVDEWLTRPWGEMARWSDPRLVEWHNRLHKDNVFGEFETVKRCAEPGEWQVSVDFHDVITYFSLSERPDYEYTMKQISDAPRIDCSGADESQNLPLPTLFPTNQSDAR